ncbi:DUF3566 domain-containing protein [Zhihengliuella flava]|uniref:Membrane protein n=1 Tax=Zhihengliuella flava TaxID=1285193 RepID=A0A931GFI8_9MICC|nr:putative membrane protein [Zhihengliuella flava]
MSTPNSPRPSTRPASQSGSSAGQGQRPVTGNRPASSARPAPSKPRTGSSSAPSQKSASQKPAGQKAASSAPAQGSARPSAGQQQKLVRPAPKAKVRKARLLVSKVDPWSVLKLSFLLSVALGIVTVVAAVVLWTVLDLTGVFDSVNNLLQDMAGSGSGFNLAEIASLGQVAAFATIVAVVNVVLITALSTLAGVLYNISSSLVGGIGVTLTDD